MIKMAENDDLININLAAKLIGISKLTLRNWDNKGILKAIRIGNRKDRRYRKQDIDEFLSRLNPQYKEIDKKAFQAYIDQNEFWVQEGPMVPIGVYLPIKRMIDVGKYFKPGIKFCIYHMEKDYGKQIMSVQESISNCKAQFETLEKNPQKMRKFLSECIEKFNILEKTMDRLDFVHLENLSKQALLDEFNRFAQVLNIFWSYCLFIEPYEPYLDEVYCPNFEKLVGDKKKAKQAFSLLTLPTKPSFFSQEKKSLLKIIIKFLDTVKERKIFLNKSNPEYLADIRKRKPEFFNSLSFHQQKYFWIQNSYAEETYLDISDFLEFIRETLKESSIEQLKNELKEIENQDELIKKQNNLIKEIKLTEKTINELKHIQEVTIMKDERKRLILIMDHHIFRFLKEFSKRTGFDFKLIGYATIEEIPNILERNFDINILNKRKDLSFWVSQEPDKFSIFTDNEALSLKEKFSPLKKLNEKPEELHGNTASRGGKDSILGKVKVILEPKNQTIGKDEILVTSMTRPDFVPLMKKASAVITDEGGITSHAAIVARELNKPCIIGTKNATKVLKTGDKVELRLNHGVVKILKQKNGF